ncbi:sensor histidine kinase [Rhodococcoides fascians]|uniref:sensor histidine kinase n=1 Tax=Rhodococcoides fascians TaxID=1828 RepID=UPI000560F1BB|nr:ATP-binding protein [Rhodococcus fascians]
MTWRRQTDSREFSPGERLRILVARFLGVGFVGYFFVSLSGIAEGSRILASWWTPLAVVLIFVPGVALLVAALVRPRRIGPAAGSAALGILLAACLWFFAWNGDVLHGSARGTWMSAFAGLAGLCATLAWRPWIAFAVQLVATSTIATVDQIGLFGGQASTAGIVYAGLWSFGLSALLTAAVIMALRSGSILDSTKQSLDRSAAIAAAAQAREREKARFDALIHDQVLSTLLATDRADAGGRLVAEARSALAELDRVVDDSGRDATVSADGIFAQLSTLGADHGVAVGATIDDGRSQYPGAVASAVVGASAEAVRNSIVHAGPAAQCRITVELRPGLVRVTVEDGGVGFDTSTTGSGRLGIDVSIVGRMAQLEGGSSHIRSFPGAGTTVIVSWEAP